MDWDKVKQQRRAEAKVKMPDTSNSNPKITDDDVNGFLNSIDSATKDVEKYLTEPTYSTRDERSGYRSTIRNQRNKANEIALHVAQNRNKYSNSDEILNYLDNYIESLKGLATGVSKYGDFYSSNFKSEDDYNNYLDSIKKQEELLNFDTAAANKELSGLEAARNNIEYDVAYDTARSSRFGVSARKNIGVDQTERENLDRRISELKQKITLASRAQNAEKLRNNALNDIEFKKYSDQGASIKNPSMRDAEGFMTVFGKPIGGEDIGNIVTYSRDNWKEIAMGGANGGTVQGNAIYKYMTGEEVDIYNYYLAKEGAEKASEYLDSITENLNMRQALGIYDELEDKTALQYVFGVSAGLDQFGSGVRNTVKAIKGDDSYTPASSTQIASSMIREGLADDGAKLPEWMGGGSVGQLGYDAITNTTNNLPSMLVGSIFGPEAGAITMGASVYGNAYSEMINLGYDKNQANSYAALTAASEAGLQYLLGGIYSLGGKVSNNVLKRIISNVDNAFAKIAIQYGGEMMSEFTEEYLQDVLDPYFKNLATGENNEVTLLSPDAMYSGILGALNAGASNVTFGAINNVANNSYLNNYYKETYGEGVDSLIQEGLATEKDSKSYSLAEKLKAKTESGEDISGAAIRKLVEANEKQFNNADTAKIESAAEQRLKSLGETGDSAKIAKALTKQVKGEVLSVSEQKAFDNSKYGQRVMNELSPENIRSGSYSSSWAENIGTDRINADLYNLARETAGVKETTATSKESLQVEQNAPKAKQESVGAKVQTSETTSLPKAKNAVQSEFKASESGKTINNITGSESDVAEIVKIKNGEMTLKLENGETVNAKNVSYGSQGEALIYETVAKLDNISAPAADVLVKAYNSSGNISADVYARGIEEAYRYGKYNIPVSEMLERGAFAAELTAEQRNKAYRLGQMFGGKSIAKAQAIRTQSTMGQVKKAVSESKKGRVHFDGNMESLNERQRTSVSALEKISEALGVDFYLFESAEVNGKRQGANGWYDPKDGSIHIDIYAGQNGEATMLFTAAHELTHFIKDWSPAKFKVLANFLMQEYGREGVSVDSLVRAQQEKAARNGRDISYDVAYEEVIADSMETMLADGNVMEKLAQLKAKDKTLWEKIKSFIDELVNKIREVYEGLTPNSEEGQYVAEMKDSIEKIQQLFTEGLIEAGDNYQSSKKSAADGNKFSIRENAEDASEAVKLREQLLAKREELQKNDEKQDKLEDSKEYEELISMIKESGGSPEALAKYKEWDEKTGFSEIVKRGKQLAAESKEIYARYEKALLDEEKAQRAKSIEKSGLSETDYNRKQAVEEFGYTPYFYDAGYILPNGKMLNFSGEKGAHYGSRGQDHRAIGTIYVEDISGSEAMLKFMSEGNIRIMPEGPSVDISSVEQPTKEQYAVIKKFVREYSKEEYFSIDFTDAKGHTVGSYSYEGKVNADRVVNDIKYFFENGETRPDSGIGQFLYSMRDSDGNELSKEQQEYFKDSKVRDENGRLIVLYHGGFKGTVFNGRGEGFTYSKNAIYMTDEEAIASAFAYGSSSRTQNTNPYKLYANLKNPFIIDAEGHSYVDIPIPDDAPQSLKDKFWYDNTADMDNLPVWAEAEGYDGIICYNVVEGVGGGPATDVVAFNSSQVKSIDNKTPTTDPDIRYSDRDSDGRKLSEQQQSYFKDSKVRDENGNLLVVYHGTRKADFTKFSRNYNFFTDSKDMADSYSQNGELYTGYLDIKNPFTIDAKGEKWSKIPIDTVTKKFLDSYGSSTFKEKGQWRTTPADIAAAIQDGIDEGEFDYDGIIIKNVDDTGSYYKDRDSIIANDYIVFNSKQFKNADNKAPTADADIRYSDRDSDGRELSEEQTKFFKNSVVRDAEGRLLPMYHGTANGGAFTIFEGDKLSNKTLTSQIGQGFYFTNVKDEAKAYMRNRDIYGKESKGRNPYLHEVYLNITNPLNVNDDIDLDAAKAVFRDGDYDWFFDSGIPFELNNRTVNGVKLTKTEVQNMSKEEKASLYVDYLFQVGGTKEVLQNMPKAFYYDKQGGLLEAMKKNLGHDGIVDEFKPGKFQYVAFSSEQIKQVDNKTPTTDPDIRYSDRDSDGNELSEQQQEYFKDSKVRDEEGNLLVVYHGTDADFTVFNPSIRTQENRETGIWFSDSEKISASYSHKKPMAAYLNIKNPFIVDGKGKSSRFLEAPAEAYDKDLGYITNYDSSTRARKGKYWDTIDYISYAKDKGYDGVIFKNIADSGIVNTTDEIGTVYAAFDSNQVKLVDNKTPTSNLDIRYQLRDVDPVQPASDKWQRTSTTAEVMERFPDLWNVTAEESEVRNPTQITGTVKSYRKIYDFLKDEGFDGKILDASSGLGYGTRAGIEEYGFDVEDIEPYPDKSYHPKYKDYSKLNKKYDVIISNAVLNVIPQDQRDALVVKMGELLNEGGRMFINVRGKDVENASSKVAINKDLMEYYISNTGSYQKGFTKAELVAYLQDALGDGFTVKASNMFGAVSAVVEKGKIGESALFQDRIDIADRNRAVILQNKAERLEKELADLERAYGEVIRREYEQNIKPNEETSKRAARINEKAAKRFMNEVGATFYVAKTEREQYLLPIINEIIDKGPEISDSEGLIEELYRTAYRHSSEYIVQDSERDQNLKDYIRKTSIYVDPGTRSDVGDYNRFCKSNMGSLKLTSDTRALSLDEFYEEVKNAAPDMFSGTSDGAEQLYELSAFMQKRTESIGDYMSEDEFVDWAMSGENSLDTGLENLFDTTIGIFISEATRKEKERKNAANINRAMENVRSAVEHYGAAQGYAREEGFLAGQIEQGAQMAKELRQKQESFNRKAEGYEKSIEAKRKKISELRAQRDELLEKARAEKREALANARQKAIEAQKEIITRYQESRKKAVEGREQTAMRNKVKGVVAELNHLLLNGTKDRHVMIGLQKAVAEALDAVNMDTIGADERVAKYDALIAKANDPDVIASLTATRDRIRRQGDNLSEKIAQLKAAYGDIKNSDDPLVANGYDEVIASKIDAVVSTVGNTPLRAMSTKQLEDVYDMYKMVLTRIRGANESFKSAKKEAISVLGNRVMMEVEHVGGKHPYRLKGSEKIEGFMWNNLKPVYAFEKIGSKTLTEVYNNVRAGEDTFAKDVTEAREFFVKENRKYHYDKWNMDKTFSFKSKTGQSFKLTIPQIMSLYAYSKRNQADKHLELGGFVFDSNIEVTQKKKGIPVKYTVNTATAHNISKETLGDIIGKLTAEQKAFVDEMQDFLSTTMGEKGNEVSLKMYGVKLFKEKHYFPLKSAKQFMFEQNETAGEVKLKNSGFSKETVVNASNPIILSNFMDVWANHVNDMSMYHSFVLPLEDFNRVFNYKTPNSESLDTESVKQFIQNAYGKEANAYIKQLLTDLNGGAVSDPRETAAKRLISNFKKAAVFSSASVVIQQPSAIGRALAIIDPKYFVGGKIGARGHSALWAEVKKYAPVAIIKEMGYFDTNMGRSTVDFITAKEYKGFAEKAKGLVTDSGYRDEVLSKAPALADEITWCAIWNAVKRETKAKHKELTPGSEEFLKAAGARFTEVITKTQVYDSILSRSANMRSKSTFMSMWTSFMGEPTTSINMIEDAIRQGKRGNKKYAAKAIGSVFTSMVLNSLLVSLVYAARDDDEDETYLEKYLASLTSEVIEGINPLTYLPFFKDVWSSLQGFDIERADMSLITKLIESTQKAYKVYTEDTEDMSEEELLEHDKKVAEANWSIVDGISSLIGLPVKNIRRDINGAINLVRTVEKDLGGRKTTKGSLADKIEEAVRKSVPILGWGKGESRGDRLYDAIIAGDETYVNRIKDSIGDDQKYANMRFATLRDNDPRIKEAAQTAFGGDYAGAKKIAEAIIAEGNFSRNEVFSVISTELTKLKNAGKENSYEEKDKLLFGANDFFNAAKNNNVKDANAIRDELIAKKQDEGYLKWEAINSVESSFASEVKKSYIDGDITAQKAKDILMKYGGKESVSEAETEIKKWNFELKQGYTWSARARGYRLGDISKQELISAVMDIEGDDEEGAELYIRFLDLAKNNEDIEITSYDASSYFKYAEPAGIEVATYLDYKDEASKCKGEKDEYGNTIRNTKKAQILLVIDALPITNEQKDALYFANGWAQSTLKDAPWH